MDESVVGRGESRETKALRERQPPSGSDKEAQLLSSGRSGASALTVALLHH